MNNNALYYILETNNSVYKFKITKFRSDYMINIGSNINYCVQIKFPIKGTVGQLIWIQAGTGGECSLDQKEQRGELLVQMTSLGITVAKEINEDLEYLTLQDSASFKCKMPDNSTFGMNSTLHDLAFYQMSYYEKRFGAILLTEKEQSEYIKSKEGFFDSEKKPTTFDFGIDQLNDELQPLYTTSDTWASFFDKVRMKYKDKKCTVLVGWIMKAIKMAMGNLYNGEEWKIDVRKIPIVVYKHWEYATKGGSGKRRIRKTRKQEKETHVPDIVEMDWKGYFDKLQKKEKDEIIS